LVQPKMLPLLKKKSAGDSAVCVRPVCPILTVLEFLRTSPLVLSAHFSFG
jgi:hypothetical protein